MLIGIVVGVVVVVALSYATGLIQLIVQRDLGSNPHALIHIF